MMYTSPRDRFQHYSYIQYYVLESPNGEKTITLSSISDIQHYMDDLGYDIVDQYDVIEGEG